MNEIRADHPDAERARLRNLVAAIDRQIQDTAVPAGGLLSAWNDLVAALNLGPQPEVRECPHCHHLCMRAATLCSSCWNHIPAG